MRSFITAIGFFGVVASIAGSIMPILVIAALLRYLGII